MELGKLMDLFRGRVDDKAEPYLWPDDEVTQWFNEAEQEACVRASLITDSVTPAVCDITVTAGDASYPLHAKVTKVMSAVLTNAYGVEIDLEVIGRADFAAKGRAIERIEGLPLYLIEDEAGVQLAPIPAVNYELALTVHRLPLDDMEISVDEPEIHAMHHARLVDWPVYRAYSKRDPDTYDPDKAAAAEATFTRSFGPRLDANVLRKHKRRGTPVVRPIGF